MLITITKEISFKDKEVLPINTDQDIYPTSSDKNCCIIHKGKAYILPYQMAFEIPSDETIEQWIMGDNLIETPDGFDVEPDGKSFNGFPSWLRILGLC